MMDVKLIYPRLAAAVQLISAQIANHGAASSDPPGAERFKRSFRALIAAFPDFHITVEDQIAEGDTVVVRWTDTGTHLGEFAGAAPAGKPMMLTGIDILRIADGRIVERWSENDNAVCVRGVGGCSPWSPAILNR